MTQLPLVASLADRIRAWAGELQWADDVGFYLASPRVTP